MLESEERITIETGPFNRRPKADSGSDLSDCFDTEELKRVARYMVKSTCKGCPCSAKCKPEIREAEVTKSHFTVNDSVLIPVEGNERFINTWRCRQLSGWKRFANAFLHGF